MRLRIRTLMIAVAVVGMALAGCVWVVRMRAKAGAICSSLMMPLCAWRCMFFSMTNRL